MPTKTLRAQATPAKNGTRASPPKGAPAQRSKTAPATEPPTKAAKVKLVRDNFTIPDAEFAVIDELKKRTAVLGRPSKKSELLRAGLRSLSAMNDARLLAAMKTLPSLAIGRPKGKKASKADKAGVKANAAVPTA